MKSLLILVLACTVFYANGQAVEDEQVFTLNTTSLKSFNLHNMNGAVNVKGVEGNTATLKIRRRLESFSRDRLEEARESIAFDSLVIDNNVYFFTKHPDLNFEIDESGIGHYNSCCNRSNNRKKAKVKYEFEIELLIPRQLKLHVSTHRKTLRIQEIQGKLVAKNHHDDLFAENLGGNVKLKAHHGDIKASFIRNPTGPCSYFTHHGNITIGFPEELRADIYLKSHHGEFFTDFDWTSQPVAVVKNESEKGTKYMVNARTAIQVGGGGPQMEFRTWHGDIYLVKAGQ